MAVLETCLGKKKASMYKVQNEYLGWILAVCSVVPDLRTRCCVLALCEVFTPPGK